jgi:hypothetical protein
VLPTRNGDYGRSREVARRQLASDGSYAEAVLSGNVLWKCARTLECGFV